MSSRTLLLLAAIALAAWLYTRDSVPTRRGGGGGGGGHETPAAAQGPGVPDTAVYRPEIADGVFDEEIDWWRDNATSWHQQVEGYKGEYSVDGGDAVHTLQEGLDDAGAEARFHRQMYVPASRVKLSELSKQDLENAHRLLAFQVNWQNYRRRDSEKLIDDDHTATDWSLGVSIVGKVIAAFVPAFGVAEGYLSAIQNAIGVGTNAIGTAAIDQRKNVDKELASLSLDQKQYLAARLSCPAAPKYQRRDDPATNDPYLEDAPHIKSEAYSNDANSADARAVYLGLQSRPWTGANGEKFYSRNALFYPLIFHPASGLGEEAWAKINRGENVDHWDSGCACWVHAASQEYIDNAVDLYSEPRSYLRWSCEQTLGQSRGDESLTGLKARTVRRAHLYRALDLLACLLFPESVAHPGLYYYRNPVFGDLRGSIFPRTEEDTAIAAEYGAAVGVGAASVLGTDAPIVAVGSHSAEIPVGGGRFGKLVGA